MKNSAKAKKSAFLATTGFVSVLFATPAFADCSPDPATGILPVTCTGLDTDGLTITSPTYVDVVAGAEVSKIVATAISAPGTYYPNDNFSKLNVSGTVHGVVVESGQRTQYYPVGGRTDLDITVASGGVIDGLGVQLRQTLVNSGFPQPYTATARVTNSGSISATSGAGLIATNTDVSSFSYINNLAGGTIRGIYAPFYALDNRGTISANGGEAIVYLSPYFGNGGAIDNYGTISSDGGGFATIDVRLGRFANQFFIRNLGNITNSGAGVAIAAGQSVPGYNNIMATLDNSGTISSGGYGISVAGNLDLTNSGTITGGTVAVYASSSLKLRNTGTINGTVQAGGLTLFPWQTPTGSTIFLGSGSHINGDLILGAGDDVVQIAFGGGSLTDLVTGTIDVGGGNNSLRYLFGPGLTEVNSALIAPSGFQSFGAELSNGADVRLVSGFTLSGPLSVTAGGDYFSFGTPFLTNATTVVSTDTAFILQPRSSYYASSIDFINTGSITANLADPGKFAVVIHDGYFDNYGTVVATGGNAVFSDAYGLVLNRAGGSVTADGTAFNADNSYNLGSITSLHGTAVNAYGLENYGPGTIWGQSVGARINGSLINTGTITSPGSAVLLGSNSSVVDNRSGGVITGSGAAIAIDPATYSYGSYRIINGGTINGNVNLSVGSFTQGNSYEAIGTGTLNGNLYLGQGRLIVEYGRSGPLGGISGSIFTYAGATLQYRITQDTSLVYPGTPTFGPFTDVVWNLQGAKLTLTGPAPVNPYILVDGFGSVDITANVTSNALRPIIEGYVSVNNLGTLTITHSDASQDPTLLGAFGTYSATNSGTIIVKDIAPAASGILARGMSGSSLTVNNGQIQVSGAIGVANGGPYGYAQFENNGTISQLRGGAAGIGVVNLGYATNRGSITTAKVGVINLGNFDNSGTVRSEGPAVQMGSLDPAYAGYGGGSVQNFGLLESTKGPAIRGLSPAGSYAIIFNQSSGIIRGKIGGPTIDYDNTVNVQNYGLIDGDVLIGLSNVNYPYWAGNSFYSYAGSTLKGNLTFGSGSDVFYYRGGSVTGTVDAGGGEGSDALYLDFSQSSATGFDLRKVRNFENLQVFGGTEFTFSNAPAFQNVTVIGMKGIIPATQVLTAQQNTQLINSWLQVDGTLNTGLFDLGYGSILSGSGKINGLVQVGQGFIVPGSDGVIAKLTIVGSVSFPYGGTMMFDVGPGESDRLVIKKDTAGFNGNIVLSSQDSYFTTALNLHGVGGGPRFGKVYTIITAESGVNGQFGSVQGSFGVLTPRLTYGANAVTLTFTASSLAAQLPLGATPLELAFAKSLDGLRTSNYASLGSLYGTVDLLDPRSLGLALDGLSPHVAVEAAGFYQQQNAQMFDLVTDRMALLGSGQVTAGRIDAVGLSGGVAGLVNAPAASQFAAAQSSLTRSFSEQQLPGVVLGNGMTGFISGGVETRRSQLSQGAQQGADRRNWHMAMGLEFPLGDKSRLGVAVLHAEGISGRSGMQTDVVSSQAAAYATWELSPRAYVGGAASMGVNHVGLQRQSWVDSSALNLTGRGTSFSYAVQAEAGYRQPLGNWGAITPRVALRQSSFSIDRLNERGGQAALRLTNIGQSQLDMRIGLRFDARAKLGSGWQISPRAEVEYVRTLTGGEGEMTVQFAAVNAAGFVLPFGQQGGGALRAKGGVTVSRQQTSFTLAGSSEQDWAGRRDSRVAAEVRFGF